MSKQGTDKKGTASRLYIDLFENIGAFFLEFYNEVNQKELYVFQQYTSMLEDARNKELSGIIDEEFLVKDKTDNQPKDEKCANNLDLDEMSKQTINRNDRTFAIGTKGESKKDNLLRSFDVLKNDFTQNSRSLADIVSKMFEIDRELAIDMWTYLINEYHDELGKADSFNLTGKILYDGCDVIGEAEMDEIVVHNSTIKNAIFLYNRHVKWSGIYLIQRKIINGELQTADELIELCYNNAARRVTSSWYEFMDYLMPNCKITNEAYELLEMWCEKVDDIEERAKLNVKMMELFD